MTRKICAVVTAIVIAACIFTAGCNKTDYADFYAFSSPVHAEVSGTLSDEIKTELKDLMSALEAEFSVSGGTFTARFNALSAPERSAGKNASGENSSTAAEDITNTEINKTFINLSPFGYLMRAAAK